jgi:hypothetical protein
MASKPGHSLPAHPRPGAAVSSELPGAWLDGGQQGCGRDQGQPELHGVQLRRDGGRGRRTCGLIPERVSTVSRPLLLPVAPVRIGDIRPTTSSNPCNKPSPSPLGVNSVLTLSSASLIGVPGSAVAAVASATATAPTAWSFLTAYRAGGPTPTTSHLNWMEGATVANRVIVSESSSGVGLYNVLGQVEIVVDLEGYCS